MTGGWALKGAIAGGRDISDSPIEIRAGVDVPDVVVTFTDQPSELTGMVIDGAGRPTPDFPIIVFSTDRSYWTLGSRRVQTARPASDGKYKVTGLPAGEYFVCAVTAVDRTEVYDPAFLGQLVGRGVQDHDQGRREEDAGPQARRRLTSARPLLARLTIVIASSTVITASSQLIHAPDEPVRPITSPIAPNANARSLLPNGPS